MPRFVVLRHEPGPGRHRPLHWDLMLEMDHGLRTWALEREPVDKEEIRAESLADHRKDYLEYEGPVSAGRGRVARWESGQFLWLVSEPLAVSVRLDGVRLQCRVDLERESEASHLWTARFSFR